MPRNIRNIWRLHLHFPCQRHALVHCASKHPKHPSPSPSSSSTSTPEEIVKMASPHEYSYGNQQQQPYPNQQYPPPQYNAPPQYGYYQAQPAPYRRTPRQNFAVVTARQLNIAIPVAIIILSIWWSLRSQNCPSDVPIGHECSWMLWTALPVVRMRSHST